MAIYLRSRNEASDTRLAAILQLLGFPADPLPDSGKAQARRFERVAVDRVGETTGGPAAMTPRGGIQNRLCPSSNSLGQALGPHSGDMHQKSGVPHASQAEIFIERRRQADIPQKEFPDRPARFDPLFGQPDSERHGRFHQITRHTTVVDMEAGGGVERDDTRSLGEAVDNGDDVLCTAPWRPVEVGPDGGIDYACELHLR